MPDDASCPSDFDLVRRVVDGDTNAFQPLLEAYKRHVLAIVSRHVPQEQVEELAHEVFVRAFVSLPSFKFKNRFKHWLSSIAVRSCYDYWRQAYRNREITMSSLSADEQAWLDRAAANQNQYRNDENVQKNEAHTLLEWALSRLSPEDRMVLELVHLEGYSVKEAGKLLVWTAANVKVRAFRSRKKLRALLEKAHKKDAPI